MNLKRLLYCTMLVIPVGCQTPSFLASPTGISSAVLDTPAATPTKNDSDTKRQTSALILAVAATAEARGDDQVAIQNYEKVLQRTPDNMQAMRRLGLLHARRGNSEKSIEMFRTATALQPGDAELRCDFAYSLYLGREFDEAKTQVQMSIEMEPELMRARNILGMILARTGEVNLAIAEFTQTGVPQSEVHANVAFAMLLNGDTEAAASSIKLAESLQPSDDLQIRLAGFRDSIHIVHENDAANTKTMFR
jgi:tetratricopeptide (TPR) repeat protein